ncbi:MAG: hypothetical protein UZ21_OP11001000482 [Microgenomates bacterium OLB22]|nr:MAG: hypothetical protein UZ21_OP11001000482 [Microgenomates bacterium OLB22]
MDTEPVTAEIPNSAHILRFFDLTADQRTALQEKIHANAGRIRMFVHPHYEEYAAFMDMDEDADSARQLHEAENAFLRIISSDDPSLPPLLVILGALSSAEQQENEKILAEKSKKQYLCDSFKSNKPYADDCRRRKVV